MSIDCTVPVAGAAVLLGEKEFDRSFQALSPGIARYARSLCGDRELAQDLVQEAALRAWRSRSRFVPGTNFKAWCYHILRNCFLTKVRRDRLVRIDLRGDDLPDVAVQPAQENALDIRDFERAWARLSNEQRQSLTLVGVDGRSFEEAALIVGVPIGTIKSRVARGRQALTSLIENPQARHDAPSAEDDPAESEGASPEDVPTLSVVDQRQVQMLRDWRARRNLRVASSSFAEA